MAHNIEFNEERGTHSFFSRKEKAWHSLGQTVEEAQTSSEAIKKSNLDFEVGLCQVGGILPTLSNDTNLKIIDNSFATYRKDTNTIFGVVGKKYEVVQNREAFGFFDSIVNDKCAMFETAGALYDGRKIFITAKLPSVIKLKGEDIVDKYLLLTMSHDGSSCIRALFTPIRVVCNNTLNAALKNTKDVVKLRHTKSVLDNLSKAKELLQLTNILSDSLGEKFHAMLEKRLSDKEVLDLTSQAIFTDKEYKFLTSNDVDMNSIVYNQQNYNFDEISTRKLNMIQEINKYYFTGLGQENIQGNAFGLFNAFSGYYQNVKKYKTSEDKYDSIFDGGSAFNYTSKIMDVIDAQ